MRILFYMDASSALVEQNDRWLSDCEREHKLLNRLVELYGMLDPEGDPSTLGVGLLGEISDIENELMNMGITPQDIREYVNSAHLETPVQQNEGSAA